MLAVLDGNLRHCAKRIASPPATNLAIAGALPRSAKRHFPKFLGKLLEAEFAKFHRMPTTSGCPIGRTLAKRQYQRVGDEPVAIVGTRFWSLQPCRLFLWLTLIFGPVGGCNRLAQTDRAKALIDEVRSGKSDAIDLPTASDQDLFEMKELHGLRHLIVDRTLVSDQGMSHLSRLADLRSLALANTRVTDTGLSYLTNLLKLRFLRLDGIALSDDGLEPVGQLVGLRYLSLFQCRVTDRGLGKLSNLRELVVLSLDETKVTANGVRELIEHLPQLRYLSVWHTGVDEKTCIELSALRPNLRVNR